MRFIFQNSKSILKFIIVSSLVFIIISSNQFSPLNPIVYKTRLWVEDAYVFGGIRISEEQGLSSYGNHSVGLLNDSKIGLTTQSTENNYYDYHLEINKSYLDGKLELSNEPNIQLGYYDRNTGFTVRNLPYLIHKTNVFDITPSKYVENAYFLLTSLIFGLILFKISEKEGLLVTSVFLASHSLYWIFIIHTRSFATPYLVCIIPFFIPFTKLSTYLYKKKTNFIFLVLVLLIPFLEHITVGYLHVISLLTGIYFMNGLTFLQAFIKNNYIKLSAALGTSLILSQVIVVLQNYYFLNQSFSNTLQSHWYNLTKRSDGAGVFNCFGEGSFNDVLNMYVNSKILNLQIFELTYFNLTLITLVFVLTMKYPLKRYIKISEEAFYLYLGALFLTMLWFTITKSHALCHPHFQPMLFLYSTFPLISLFYGRLVRSIYEKISGT
tara:strand:- start:1796 stop:3109 length:1314 start_codon:yes stop_codon:yes gene_type:complete